MLYDYLSEDSTSSGQCSNNNCPQAIVSSNPVSGAQVNFPTYVTLTSDVEGATIHYTIDGTAPDTLSQIYTGPILIESAGVTVRAIAQVEGCAQGSEPAMTAAFSNASFSFVFSYACDTPDKSGPWDTFTPDGGVDHHWILQFTLAGAVTIKRLELYQLDADGNWTTGQVWSTDSPINPTDPASELTSGDDFFCYPLVVFIAAVQQWTDYQDTLGSYGAGSHTWDLYGDTVIAAGGLFRLDIILDDDTKLSQTIEAVCTSTPPLCPSPATPTVTGKCDGKVDVTFSGTVGRDFVIYGKTDSCSASGWEEVGNGTIDVSPKTVEIPGMIEGCIYQFYVSIDEAGCGFKDSAPTLAVLPLPEPVVTISTNKTIVDPNESFTISWTSNNIGGAVCGGCLDGQVSINQSMGCKAGNASGSQAQSQAVCGIYTYQITGCNTCGTAVASVQVEVRCPTVCPDCSTRPATLSIANPGSFLCPVDDWCCKSPVVCGPGNCGPGPAYNIGQFPTWVAWNGVMYRQGISCTWRTSFDFNLGGCPGPSPGSAYPIIVTVTCQVQQAKWFLGIQNDNGSSAGCFGNWWQGEKSTGNEPTGTYIRVSGCSLHPASITVT